MKEIEVDIMKIVSTAIITGVAGMLIISTGLEYKDQIHELHEKLHHH